jgi:tetratricopeptide (TPR) repeat protein
MREWDFATARYGSRTISKDSHDGTISHRCPSARLEPQTHASSLHREPADRHHRYCARVTTPSGDDIRARLQASLGTTYIIDRELGGGGMSRVFVAQETRLGRAVVVKVLSPELAEGISVERFEREILLAASLQHAHIVPVLATGEVDGLPWFTMPFIEGESLRARVARGPLPMDECISILRDVARALTYAHGRDVVHRDIKPDNVMFSAGSAMVTDFGIAKALSASRTGTGQETLTQHGTSIGTPAYMAPEQAAADPSVDARADLYAFGCTAYELLTGSSPFAGRTPQRMLAAHMTETPRAVGELRLDTPSALADLVMRSLAKDANDRPQSAADIARALDTITSASTTGQPATLPGGAAMFRRALVLYVAAFIGVLILARAAIVGIGLPDWILPGAAIVMALGLPVILFTAFAQRVNRQIAATTPTLTPGGNRSLAAPHGTLATIAIKATPYLGWQRTARGGVMALSAFVIATAVVLLAGERGFGPAATLLSGGRFTAADRILVGDFIARTPDTTLGTSVVEAVRAELADSRDIHLVDPVEVRAFLDQMRRPATTPLTPDVAHELAQRAGAKAYLTGDISLVGTGYAISASLVDASTGATLLDRHVTAASADRLIAAIDDISHRLREGIGGSLRSLHASEPLEQAITPSLPALRLYSAALRANYAGDNDRCVILLREAVRADTAFAMAWRKLGTLDLNSGNRSEGDSALAAALRHSDRLTPYTRYLTLGVSAPVAEDRVAATRLALEVKPGDALALSNLGEELNLLGRWDEGEVPLRQAIAGGAPWGTAWNGLVSSLAHQGKWAAADSVPTWLMTRLADTGQAVAYQMNIAMYRRNVARADSLFTRWVQLPMTSGRRRGGEARQRIVSEYRGQLQLAERHAAAHATQVGTIGGPQVVLGDLLVTAAHDALLRNRPQQALTEMQAVLTRMPLDSIPAADRPYQSLGEVSAYAGSPANVRQYRAASAVLHPTTPQDSYWNALQAIAERRWADAAAAAGAICDTACADGLWYGYVLDRAGQGDSALRVYARFIDKPTFSTSFNEVTFYPLALFRLGALYQEGGNSAPARVYLSRFVALWRNADPELQPMVADAVQRLARLGDVAKTSPLPGKP